MKNSAILLLFLLSASVCFAQRPAKKPSNPSKTAAAPKSGDSEQARFERLAARASAADEKMRGGDASGGAQLFKAIVADATAPVSDRIFTEVLLPTASRVFAGGERVAALEIAGIIEKKIDGSANQLLGLATFYLTIENADEAKRLAEKAVLLEPNQPAAYQTLGIANRLNFDLEAAANSYSKALELAPDSNVSKRSLAEMRRATGDFDKAVALYREITAKDAGDKSARNGLILSLFDAGQRAEAEAEMTKSLAENPNNLILLVGASYWFAAQGESRKAVELAQKALAVEPRYIWGYIAQARGLSQENRFNEAERALLAARNYGNFPTLDYELAAVRHNAGYYREAAQDLAKTFAVKGDAIRVKLGGRVEKSADNFIELLAPERRASIFEPIAADTSDAARKLKELLLFHQTIESADAPEADITGAADKFVDGADKMKLYRQIFVAERLLEKKRALPKVGELMRSATGAVEAALGAAGSSAATLAEQLYDSRALAVSRNEIVVVPEVPRLTLSNILRGRIEEISGWALYQEGKTGEAVVRLRRAASVLPEKSAFWRSGVWRLGAALQADGKPSEALDAYLKSYPVDAPDAAKRIVIEGLYRQVNGSLDGLDARIGAKPAPVAVNLPAQTEAAPTPADSPAPAADTAPTVEVSATPEKTLRPAENPPVAETATAEKSAVEAASAKSQKPLFEPVVITVPKTEIPAKNDNAPANDEAAKTSPCKISVSQEKISILRAGGDVGILVGFAGKTPDASEVKAISASPENVEVVAEPAKNVGSSRAFVLKAVGDAAGVFTIAFEAACGRRVINVTVR